MSTGTVSEQAQFRCFLSYQPVGEPFQRFHLYLCAPQLTKGFLGSVHFQMAVRSPQGGFQFGKICSAQQVIHACPHLVAPGGTIGKGLSRSRMIRIADGLSSCVKVCRDHFGKALHREPLPWRSSFFNRK